MWVTANISEPTNVPVIHKDSFWKKKAVILAIQYIVYSLWW